MDGFTLVDAGVILVILISALLAYSRGFVREILSIAGWIIAAAVAVYFAPTVEPIIKELPGLNSIIGQSCQLAILAAFAVVFVIALIVVSLFSPLISGSVQNSSLGAVDSGLGLLFGVARGVLLVAVAFVIYDQAPFGEIAMIDDAASQEFLQTLKDRVVDMMPTEIPPQITNTYDQLMGRCSE